VVVSPGAIDTVVVDYGGVLTNPLIETFAAFAQRAGVELPVIAAAFAAATRRYGVTPMAALEVADITEDEMVRRLLAELPPGTAGALAGRPFGELWFLGRRPNEEFLDYLAGLRRDGYRLALLTNNVREWEDRWRSQIPDGLFGEVVNSAHERVRKPDPRIYRTLLQRLDAGPSRLVFVDDTEENCAAARELGIRTVEFTDTRQAIADLDQVLDRARAAS
jgi:putative hydrolase of the HAD superfamily